MIDDDDPFAVPVKTETVDVMLDDTDPFAVPPSPAIKIVSRSSGARTGKGRPALSIVQTLDVVPDDPFKVPPGVTLQARKQTLPFDRCYNPDDPFTAELRLPFIVAERCMRSIDIVLIGVDGWRTTIRSIGGSREDEALAAAEMDAISRDAMLITGVHPTAFVAALESGIKAALRSIETRAT
jgi:hypothetical protein